MVPKCQSRGHDLVRDLGSGLVILPERSNFAAQLFVIDYVRISRGPTPSRVHGHVFWQSYHTIQSGPLFLLSNYPCSRSCIQTLANIGQAQTKNSRHPLSSASPRTTLPGRTSPWPSWCTLLIQGHTALSPSLHSFKEAHQNCLPYRPRIPNLSLNVLCADYFHLLFPVP